MQIDISPAALSIIGGALASLLVATWRVARASKSIEDVEELKRWRKEEIDPYRQKTDGVLSEWVRKCGEIWKVLQMSDRRLPAQVLPLQSPSEERSSDPDRRYHARGWHEQTSGAFQNIPPSLPPPPEQPRTHTGRHRAYQPPIKREEPSDPPSTDPEPTPTRRETPSSRRAVRDDDDDGAR